KAWSVVLDGTNQYTYTAVTTGDTYSDDMAGVVAALVDKINSETGITGHVATVDPSASSKIIISKAINFTAQYTVTTTLTAGTGEWLTTVSLSSTPVEGQTWTLLLNGSNSVSHQAGDPVDGFSGADLYTPAAIAKAFVDTVNSLFGSEYTAILDAIDNTRIILRDATDSINFEVTASYSITSVPTATNTTISGILPDAWIQEIQLLGDDSFINSGDTWTIGFGTPIDIDGDGSNDESAINYSDADDLDAAAAGLEDEINVLSPLAGTVDGSILTLIHADGVEVPISAVTHFRNDALSASSLTPHTDEEGEPIQHYNSVEITLDELAPINPGDLWRITVNGINYDFMIPDTDTWGPDDRIITNVAQELIAKINENTPSYEASLKFALGKIITIEDRDTALTGPDQTITVDISRGGGKVTGIFDIDNSNMKTGISSYLAGYNPITTRVLVWDFWPFAYHYETVTIGYQPIYEYYSYVERPILYVYKANVNASDDITGFGEFKGYSEISGLIDQGSTSTYDPFLQIDFTEVGTYMVLVGSKRYYADNTRFYDYVHGVSAGLSYQLNVSLQEHATNENAIELKGAQVQIVDGRGVGQVGTIHAYEPELNKFTLEDPWVVIPDSTSVIQFQRDLILAPVADEYEVVLTNQPSGDVILDVVPQVTRTYNSDLAFDEEANFGENKAVQVQVATSRSEIELFGTPANGEEWTILLNDEPFTVAVSSQTLENIARELAEEVDNSDATPGSPGDDLVYKSSSSGAMLTVWVEDAGEEYFNHRFYTEFATQDTAGEALVDGSRLDKAFHWIEADIDLSGSAAVGETWRLVLDGQVIEYNVQNGTDTLTNIRDNLESTIDSSIYSYTPTGTSINDLKRIDGAEFTAEFSVTKGEAIITPKLKFTAS
ncbi:hypothetical protein ACFLZG_07650, partial [Thermodesulfobacteriota bacterium]